MDGGWPRRGRKGATAFQNLKRGRRRERDGEGGAGAEDARLDGRPAQLVGVAGPRQCRGGGGRRRAAFLAAQPQGRTNRSLARSPPKSYS